MEIALAAAIAALLVAGAALGLAAWASVRAAAAGDRTITAAVGEAAQAAKVAVLERDLATARAETRITAADLAAEVERADYLEGRLTHALGAATAASGPDAARDVELRSVRAIRGVAAARRIAGTAPARDGAGAGVVPDAAAAGGAGPAAGAR